MLVRGQEYFSILAPEAALCVETEYDLASCALGVRNVPFCQLHQWSYGPRYGLNAARTGQLN
jgi:hypothetical protein